MQWTGKFTYKSKNFLVTMIPKEVKLSKWVFLNAS